MNRKIHHSIYRDVSSFGCWCFHYEKRSREFRYEMHIVSKYERLFEPKASWHRSIYESDICIE